MIAPTTPSASTTPPVARPYRAPASRTASTRGPVPRITRWSGEILQRPARIRDHDGTERIGYRQETPHDRVNGVLVLHSTGKQGQGEPVWNRAHPGRQVRLMLDLACRVCGKPADSTDQGTLWQLPPPTMPSGRPRRTPEGWPENATVEHPPVCAAHALQSPLLCPALDGALLVRVAESPLWGVAAMNLAPGTEPAHGFFSFEDPAAQRWAAATHLLRTITGCTVLTPEELRADLARRQAIAEATG
ncbi:hypothetical protein ACFC26_17300 [Kitasatospora purpeofusca]|uniref:hypothetical protein n=1 Tax=Kitasatospora purpeofusca TaxID=67352 RepID=UPI0035DE9A26